MNTNTISMSLEDINKIFKNITKDELFSSNNKAIYKKIKDSIKSNNIYLDDTSIRHIIKIGYFYFKIGDYKCFYKKCSIKDIWLNKPIPLILNNKNKKVYDNRVENIEFYCPNCYFILFKEDKQLEALISSNKIKCQYCDYNNIQQFGKYYIDNKICKICSKKKSQVINIDNVIDNEIDGFDMGLNQDELETIDNFLLEEKLRRIDDSTFEKSSPNNNNNNNYNDDNDIFNYTEEDNIKRLLSEYETKTPHLKSSKQNNLINNHINIIDMEKIDINKLME